MSKASGQHNFAGYLTVSEAADYLGVSPWTLRNWDNSGKLKSTRHPVSGYRQYCRDALDELLQSKSLVGRQRRSLVRQFDWTEIKDTEHFVQFYEDDRYLIDTVSDYVARALGAGEAAVIIATKEHSRLIERKLKRRSVDLSSARNAGQLLALDAAETLSQFMVNGSPDAERFEASVGAVIETMARSHSRVRAFGEMVALLWNDGNREAAIQLESLWNALAKRLSFTLFCAYPLAAFSDAAGGDSLSDVCGCHTRVIPAEGYSALTAQDDQLRLIALLQQKALQLEAEIDQRKAAEQELADFIENALEGLHKVGPDGTILWANKAELDMLGYEADEYIGRHVAEFHTDRQLIEQVLIRLRRGENVYNQPAILRCKDGSLKHVLIHSNAYFQGGQFVYSRCFTRDMTELRQADRDRAMLAAIIESSQDAIISKTFDGTIRSWNAGAERIFGYTESEAIGQSITLIIPQERHDEEVEILARLRRGERIEHYETVRLAKDGRRLNISLTISPLRDSGGNPIGASKIARDITDRIHAEDELRKSEERFRRLVKLLPVGVYTCEAPSGIITFYNDRAAELWGRVPVPNDSNEKFCGSLKLLLPDGTHLPHDQCPMAVAVSEGRSFSNREVEIERPDGSRITALVNIEPIFGADGKVVGAMNVFNDVTALKQAERQLKEADRRKDEFLATLAHELRNPLAPIRNALNILRMPGQNLVGAERLHEMMDRQVAHMVRLIDDLLELSRISRGQIELKRETVRLTTIINQALETCRPLIEASNHRLEVSLPDEPILVDGDMVRLSQVFANLLNNAAKYTDRGGAISLVARLCGNEVVVSVKDTGMGIPADMLSRIFEMFAQVDNPLRRSQDGLGIGLNLVRRLVDLHEGSVEARSDGLGMGSEFIVRLPVATASGAERDLDSNDGSGSSVDQQVSRILCVDDNRDSANSLGMMLRLLGADVHTAYDGPSALEAMKICRPSIILMDLGMPGMSGYEVARQIRQLPDGEAVLLVAMTGWGQDEDRHRSHEAGFDHHLVKPVELQSLQALLASRGESTSRGFALAD